MVTKATKPNKTHVRNPLKIYFLLMTLVGVIGTLVTFGILAFTIGKQVIITNNEYIIGDRYYEIDSCNTSMIAKPTAINPNNVAAPTDAEKEKCKADKTTRLIQSRKATFKTDVLG
ncbi:MAG: hypothetical protein WCL02_06780 [bacterium]